MTNIMTNRIQDSELREFIQDSIEECFDIIDTGTINGKWKWSLIILFNKELGENFWCSGIRISEVKE